MSYFLSNAYLCGDDLDADADAVGDAREDRAQAYMSCKVRGLRHGLETGPCSASKNLPHRAGGGAIRLSEHVYVNPPAWDCQRPHGNYPDQWVGGGRPTGILSRHEPVRFPHSPHFARYAPYTEVAAMNAGAWQYVPLFGGLRVALRGSCVDPAATAAAIAHRPAAWGYVLQSDTYVPSMLSPGDRYLLATSA